MVIGITESPDSCQDETALVPFFRPFRLENALFQNLDGFIRTTNTIESSTVVEKISRCAIATINVLLQQIELSLKLCRFVASRILLEDLVGRQYNGIVRRALPLLVTGIFANPVSIHAHDTQTMLLCKWQAVRMVKASRFLFKDLEKCIEGSLLERHLRKIALGSILLINDFRIRIEKNGIGVIQRPVQSVLDVLLCFFLGFSTCRAKVDEG